MKKQISFWQMAGFIFTAVLGTLLHFVFDWTGGNSVAALFSAVNESIWEHMKLLYYPMLIFSLIEYRAWGRDEPRFWCVKLLGTLFGLLIIPSLYYTYTGALGVEADWFNITIFFLAAAGSFWLETKLLQSDFSCLWGKKRSFFLLLSITALFIMLTFVPPQIPFFRDPLTGSYGFVGR